MTPNQPKTPGRHIRIPDDEWFPTKDAAESHRETMTGVVRPALTFYRENHELVHAAKDKAAAQDTTVSEVVREKLTEYVEEDGDE